MLHHELLNTTKTVYFLTRSDFKAVMLPILVFSSSVTAWNGVPKLLISALWLYLVLIEFCLSNQTSGDAVEEDRLNKPYRPIPSGLITLETARRLRWIMPFFNVTISHFIGGRLAVGASIAISLITWVHNEMSLNKKWWGKSFLAGSCFPMGELGCLAVGTTHHGLTAHQLIAIMFSAFVNIFTIFVQDFPDVVGDAANGRKTLPIMFPLASRYSIPVVLSLSTTGSILISDAHPALLSLVVLFAIFTSLRYLTVRQPEREMISYTIYAVWLTLLHASLSKLKDDTSFLPPGIEMTSRIY
ncbi:hypothetical protein BT69DRAFT_1347935 [Atractiella rhizophila]|nr:hypothetical protein BT69DRAFT_1347935 [Atractiella rhizophila]